MFNFTIFKPPYKKTAFDYWARTCYNLLTATIAGVPVILISTEELKYIYASCLVFAAVVLFYFGMVFSYTAEDFDKEK